MDLRSASSHAMSTLVDLAGIAEAVRGARDVEQLSRPLLVAADQQMYADKRT